MKFLLDENFPKTAIQLLQEKGHTCLDFREMGNKGADDRILFDTVITEDAVLLTTDRDFFHTIPHLYSDHPGAVIIALSQPNRQNILARFEWFLNKFGNTSLRNKVFELRDRTYISR